MTPATSEASATCDGSSITEHRSRAKELISHGFSHSRWRDSTPATNRERSLWTAHQRCLEHKRHRQPINEYRIRKRESFYRYRKAQKASSCQHEAPPRSQSILNCIRDGAAQYGQSYSGMVALADCESGLNRLAHNPSGASGLFQFMPSTWAGTPYGGRSIWSAKWQGLATGWMLAQGRRGEWVC